jgi:hypothetical protein
VAETSAPTIWVPVTVSSEAPATATAVAVLNRRGVDRDGCADRTDGRPSVPCARPVAKVASSVETSERADTRGAGDFKVGPPLGTAHSYHASGGSDHRTPESLVASLRRPLVRGASAVVRTDGPVGFDTLSFTYDYITMYLVYWWIP